MNVIFNHDKNTIPSGWLKYDLLKIVPALTEAKASVKSLKSVPFQKEWADALQAIQLKREVNGTSRIEGADFTDRELDIALIEGPGKLKTRSQRQAAAAVNTYRWIVKLPDNQPITTELIKEIHLRIVTGADDDRCAPGKLRTKDENVNFGNPKHRGSDGGEECERIFSLLSRAVQTEFTAHDPLIQALALHYHFAAMHPFLDGNGRTARALEALVLQRSGLRDALFIAMSNYYYDEKDNYLKTLSEVRAQGHDLTPFLIFGLTGIALQCDRLLAEIKTNLSKALFKNTATYLFSRLKTKRKRAIGERQLLILEHLSNVTEMDWHDLSRLLNPSYSKLGNPVKMMVRDINSLIALRAVKLRTIEEPEKEKLFKLSLDLEWPCTITETDFFERVKKMPKAKSTHYFT